ncbi:sigma-70 family RNA polymerase sigma factor [Kitasatospora sp. NBC_01246]|uniref:sigma-70 family RNA polymerase sigma factor n=1 Tax=Kitasatospora sp. NBC_01246 TaxID=2903570 RepID=UPI003FA6023C
MPGTLKPAIAALPERDRTILSLRFGAELTQGEIGRRLGIAQMHVSRLLDRTLAGLRADLLADARAMLPSRRGRHGRGARRTVGRPFRGSRGVPDRAAAGAGGVGHTGGEAGDQDHRHPPRCFRSGPGVAGERRRQVGRGDAPPRRGAALRPAPTGRTPPRGPAARRERGHGPVPTAEFTLAEQVEYRP